MVERRVREHHAEPRRLGGDGGAERSTAAPPEKHDRPCRGTKERPLLARHHCERVRLGRHQRERLLLPALARPQPCNYLLAAGVAGQVVAAETFDSENCPGSKESDRLLERQREPRSARRTCDRLGVEASIRRIRVFAPAVRAHRKAGHRRRRAVIGDRADDRETRPALRAVDERVAEAAVGRVEELAQTVLAGGDVGRDERGCTCRSACDDGEVAFATR